MYVVEIVLFVAGLIVLAIGYRKNHRNLLLCAAIMLFLSAALAPALGGFLEGYRDARGFR